MLNNKSEVLKYCNDKKANKTKRTEQLKQIEEKYNRIQQTESNDESATQTVLLQCKYNVLLSKLGLGLGHRCKPRDR